MQNMVDCLQVLLSEGYFKALVCAVRYKTSCEEDEAIIGSSTAGPRQKVAARLLRIEKAILRGVR